MKRTVFELLLLEVSFRDGVKLRPGGRHLLNASLVWPRPLIAQRQSVREIRFSGGPVAVMGRRWTDRVLFKETVEGRFGLAFALSAAAGDSRFDRVLRTVASQAMRQLTGGLTGDSPDSILAWLGASPFDALARELTKPGEQPVIGRGVLDRDSDAIYALGDKAQKRSALWKIPLTAPEDIVETIRRRQGDRMRSVRRTLAEAGEAVADVVVEARRG